MRILSTTVILLLAHVQLGVIGNQVLTEIIVESDQIETNREKPRTAWGQFKVYTVFALHSLLPISLLGVIFLLVARSPSLLGLIAMFATVIILHRQQASFWMESYKTIGILTQIFVLVTYLLDYFLYFAVSQFPKVLEREANTNFNFLLNVLHSNLQYFKKDQKFFTSIFWLYVILAFCFLQKRIHRYETFFKLQQPEPPRIAEAPAEDVLRGLDDSGRVEEDEEY